MIVVFITRLMKGAGGFWKEWEGNGRQMGMGVVKGERMMKEYEVM